MSPAPLVVADEDGFMVGLRPHPTRPGWAVVAVSVPGGTEGVWADISPVQQSMMTNWLVANQRREVGP